MKYLFLLVILLILFIIYKKLKKDQIEKTFLKEEEQKIEYLAIDKENDLIQNSNQQFSEYQIKIDSVTKKKNTLEFLISVQNNSTKTARINIIEADFYSNFSQEKIKADVTFYGELGMGTNDILLKNTILPDSHVIRNIYFFDTDLDRFNQNDYLEIDIEINGEHYQFKIYFHQTTLQSIKYIQ
ncbi:hypothetical protein [Empedobacter brevis]|uniref:hypothetical protein n=1 Tax=Empedobacter brevis TaxID=247 RepID=UPI0039AF8690